MRPEVDTTGRPAWLIPVAAFLCFSVSGGMMYMLLRRGKPRIGPAFARTVADRAGDMTIVPAGPFRPAAGEEETVLPSFYIDNGPVTCAAYAAFAQATRHPLPEGFSTARPDAPVLGVPYTGAQAFAAWAHKRLPNAHEWEKARAVLRLSPAAAEWVAPWPATAAPALRGGSGPAAFRCARDPR